MKIHKFKNADDLVCHTTSKTFQAYWREIKRHERTLKKIYAKDKRHKHVPEEIGCVNRVHPSPQKTIITFYRCAVCMKDLSEKEVKAISK